MNFKNISDVDKRYDFMMLFDVTDGNANGDPDAGNLPRVDPETMQGIVTDVALKRKVRDYVQLTRHDAAGYDIFIKQRGILTREQQKAYAALGIEDDNEISISKVNDAREWMCANYYDVRMFGAVMTGKKYKAGQVRGPLQLTFARSCDPITPLDITITRVALTNPSDSDKNVPEDETEARHGQMGRKAYVPYGLYIVYGFYSPAFAKQTGVSPEDLGIFWESLINMWDLDRSAARGRMATRGLYVFEHESVYGNAPSHLLFDKIKISKKDSVEIPRSSNDYKIDIDKEMPTSVNLHEIVKLK